MITIETWQEFVIDKIKERKIRYMGYICSNMLEYFYNTYRYFTVTSRINNFYYL